LRRLRRGHRHGQWADRAGDVYVIVLALIVVVGLVASSVHRVPVGALRVGDVPPLAATCLRAAAVLLAAGTVTLVLRAVGPVYAGPAGQAWLLATPGDRARWLRPRVVGLAVAATAVGAFGGLALAGVGLRLALPVVPASGALVVATGALALLGLAMALLAGQAADAVRPLPDWPRAVGRLLLGAGALVAAGAIAANGSRTGGLHVGATVAGAVGGVIVLAAVTIAIVSATRGIRAAGSLDRASLTAGAALANSAMAATTSMDPSFLFGFVEARRLRRIGRVRRRRLVAPGPITAMLVAEKRRLSRHATVLVVFAALVGLPYVCAIVLTPVPVTLVRVLAGYVAVNGMAGGLRIVSRSAALRRSLGRTDGWLRGVHLVTPAVAAVAYVVATAWAGRTYPLPLDLLMAAGLVLSVVRAATRPPMVYDSAWLVTPFGLVPVGLITQVVRGLDLAIVVAVIFAFVIR
jgi:hypothetical protein